MTEGHRGAGGREEALEARYQQGHKKTEQPAGASIVTILTFLLLNGPREPDGEAGVLWENPYATQIKAAFVVLSWSGYLSIFSLCHHSSFLFTYLL